MSIARSLTRYPTLKLAVPAFAAAVLVGIAYRYSTSAVYNDSKHAFNGGDDWIDLKVQLTKTVSHDTKHVTFAFSSPDQSSGLVTASLLLTKFVTPKGSNVIRPYTPVSEPAQKGTIDFIVKRYEGGKMLSHIHDLNVNDTLSFKGPIVKWKWEPNQYKTITLIGGGSGITPLYQLMDEIARNPSDKTKVHLIYGNKSPEDVLLHRELDAVQAKRPDQIKIDYFVDKASGDWKHHVGYISKDFLQKNVAQPSKDTKVFVCGPPGMYEAISGNKVSPADQGEVTGALAELGFNKEHVFKF